MNEALTDLKEELDSKWLSEMDVKLTEQESFYQVELAKTRSRLDGLESVIDRVIDTGVLSQSQKCFEGESIW